MTKLLLTCTCWFLLVCSAQAVDNCEESVAFSIGELAGDPAGTNVYVLDLTTPSILAIDTSSGTTRIRAQLVDTMGNPYLPSSAANGQLVLSHDHAHLYVSLPSAQRIQCYATANLQLESETQLSVTQTSFTITANGFLVLGMGAFSPLQVINPSTGTMVSSAGSYYQPLVRVADSGTRVYVLELGLSGVTAVDSWDVAANGAITAGPLYSVGIDNGEDLSVSEADQSLYPMCGGIYGLTIVDMANDSSVYASFGGSPYGSSVAQVPGSALVYASSYSEIFAFRRSDNGIQQSIQPGSGQLYRSLAMCANGSVLYRTSTQRLGIIGCPSMGVEASACIARFTATPTATPLTLSLDASSSDPGNSTINSYSWTTDAGASGSGSSLIATFTTTGYHLVTLSIANALNQVSSSSRSIYLGDYTVAFTAGPGGSLTGVAAQSVATNGTCTAVAAVPAAGYGFASWTGTAGFSTTSANPLIVSGVSADLVLTANFAALPTYDLTVVGGSGSGTYLAGTVVGITATPPLSGEAFSGWSGANIAQQSSSTTTITMPAAAETVTAVYDAAPAPTIIQNAGWSKKCGLGLGSATLAILALGLAAMARASRRP